MMVSRQWVQGRAIPRVKKSMAMPTSIHPQYPRMSPSKQEPFEAVFLFSDL